MSEAAGRPPFGTGPLARAVALVYSVFVTGLLLLLTAGPGLVLLVLLDRDASNVPLAALSALPLGPALSAALYALARRRADLADLRPAATFWCGYRLNAGGALRIWAPFLVLLTIIGVSLTHRGAAGVPGWWSALLGLIGGVALLWATNALVITSLFTFRAVDVARLAAYFLLRRGGVTLGTAGLLLVAAGVTVIWSEAVLLLLAAPLVAALLANDRTLIADVEEQFTAERLPRAEAADESARF